MFNCTHWYWKAKYFVIDVASYATWKFASCISVELINLVSVIQIVQYGWMVLIHFFAIFMFLLTALLQCIIDAQKLTADWRHLCDHLHMPPDYIHRQGLGMVLNLVCSKLWGYSRSVGNSCRPRLLVLGQDYLLPEAGSPSGWREIAISQLLAGLQHFITTQFGVQLIVSIKPLVFRHYNELSPKMVILCQPGLFTFDQGYLLYESGRPQDS